MSLGKVPYLQVVVFSSIKTTGHSVQDPEAIPGAQAFRPHGRGYNPSFAVMNTQLLLRILSSSESDLPFRKPGPDEKFEQKILQANGGFPSRSLAWQVVRREKVTRKIL